MFRKFCLLIVSLFFLILLLEGLSEAGRFGGGRSFGGRTGYQRSFSKPVAPQPGAGQGQVAPGQTPFGRRPFGGFGSMLGGMVMGSMIGSLLFGGGMRGAGGLGLLDILVIGGGLLLLFRFLKARRPAAAFRESLPFGSDDSRLNDNGTSAAGWSETAFSAKDVSEMTPRIPPGFNEQEFLKGAEAGYNRLQESWNKRDLEDIRQFTSPEVWEEIASQAREDGAPEKTEILLLKSRLLEVKAEGEDTVASVYFDVLMREGAREERPKQVREVWHFSRNEKIPGSFWRLEGIQQMEP